MSRCHLPPADRANRKWPVSERARWLPALAMAIGIIYGGDEDRSRSSVISPDLDD